MQLAEQILAKPPFLYPDQNLAEITMCSVLDSVSRKKHRIFMLLIMMKWAKFSSAMKSNSSSLDDVVCKYALHKCILCWNFFIIFQSSFETLAQGLFSCLLKTKICWLICKRGWRFIFPQILVNFEVFWKRDSNLSMLFQKKVVTALALVTALPFYFFLALWKRWRQWT